FPKAPKLLTHHHPRLERLCRQPRRRQYLAHHCLRRLNRRRFRLGIRVMNRLLISGAISIGVAQVLLGSPFLVCDPVPGSLDQFTKPTAYVITGLSSSPLSTPAFVNGDGT